jgi:DNA-binding transcriptional ArsR family regulator
MGAAADVDKVFKALAAPERRLMLDRLRARNGQTLGELCEGMKMTRQAVTRHLNVLENATLVVTRRRGREKLHYLNPMPIHEIAERWIGQYERGRLRALAELKAKLEGESYG